MASNLVYPERVTPLCPRDCGVGGGLTKSVDPWHKAEAKAKAKAKAEAKAEAEAEAEAKATEAEAKGKAEAQAAD